MSDPRGEGPRYLIALDIDGTTIDHDGVLSDAVRDSVAAVEAAGHHVVIATGRAVSGTLPILDRLGLLSGYAVSANGAVTLRLDASLPDNYEVIESVSFDPGPALNLLRAEWPDALVAVERPGAAEMLVSASFGRDDTWAPERVVTWDELLSEPVTRVAFHAPAASSEDFEELTKRIGLHGVNYAIGWTAWLDIAPEGVTKASALEQVRRRLGVEPDHTVAVGDQRNDIEMLTWAARGIAMGQAPDEVKAVADEITGPVELDGLATVLDALAAR